jgi:hypothetical protein
MDCSPDGVTTAAEAVIVEATILAEPFPLVLESKLIVGVLKLIPAI